MGQAFDCATVAEIDYVLKLGAKPEDIIFAHPVKLERSIMFAKEKGVKVMTFDCVEEVTKIHSVYPEAELVLRIAVERTNAPSPMGKKFGAVFELWEPILMHCKDLGMKVRGVSFHVGSGGCAFEQYENSLKHAQQIFEMAERLGLQSMDILDIGGGFSDNTSTSYTTREFMFPIVAPMIEEYLSNVWPAKKAGINIIAEPGRWVCQGTTSLISQVFLKKKQGNVNHYYITSGIYQGLGCVVCEQDWFKSQLITENEEEFAARQMDESESCMWGQANSHNDYILKNQLLPRLEQGDWLIFREIGAYNEGVANGQGGF